MLNIIPTVALRDISELPPFVLCCIIPGLALPPPRGVFTCPVLRAGALQDFARRAVGAAIGIGQDCDGALIRVASVAFFALGGVLLWLLGDQLARAMSYYRSTSNRNNNLTEKCRVGFLGG